MRLLTIFLLLVALSLETLGAPLSKRYLTAPSILRSLVPSFGRVFPVKPRDYSPERESISIPSSPESISNLANRKSISISPRLRRDFEASMINRSQISVDTASGPFPVVIGKLFAVNTDFYLAKFRATFNGNDVYAIVYVNNQDSNAAYGKSSVCSVFERNIRGLKTMNTTLWHSKCNDEIQNPTIIVKANPHEFILSDLILNQEFKFKILQNDRQRLYALEAAVTNVVYFVTNQRISIESPKSDLIAVKIEDGAFYARVIDLNGAVVNVKPAIIQNGIIKPDEIVDEIMHKIKF